MTSLVGEKQDMSHFDIRHCVHIAFLAKMFDDLPYETLSRAFPRAMTLLRT